QMRDSARDPESFTDADVIFHTVLLTASHNQVFRLLSSAIHAALKYALHASNIGVENREDSVLVHGQLVEALRIRGRQPCRACA
ncbi:FCD domain-containing protein, partial [Rhizobium ruizarguesonis]